MTKKQNKILVRVLSVASIVLMSLSIFTITVYKRALDEELYKEALNQSHIYEIVANVIERNVSEAIIAWEKDLVNNLMPEPVKNNTLANTALSFVLDTVIEKQTPDLVSNIFGKIGLADVFQNVTEKTIETDLQWLKGEIDAHEAFGYIPTPEQIEGIKESNFTQILGNVAKNAFGVQNLPECKSMNEVNANILRIANGNIAEVTCTTEQIDMVMNESMKNSGIGTVVDKVGSGAQELAQNSSVNELLTDVYNVSYAIAQIKQIAIDVRQDVQGILKWSYFVLFLSVVIGGFAIYRKESGGRTVQTITITFASGLTIAIIAVLHYILLSKLLLGVIPFENIVLGTNILTGAEAALLTNSIKFIVEYIVTGIVKLSFVIGVWMTILSSLAFGGVKLYENREVLKKKFKGMISKK
ncbi:MAG: hypothetical protein ACKUBY_03785 [Candidatus Moraniibacteriota bacterium]|jgi:hypothetical protein